jgi:hypothetical protein
MHVNPYQTSTFPDDPITNKDLNISTLGASLSIRIMGAKRFSIHISDRGPYLNISHDQTVVMQVYVTRITRGELK